MRTPANRQLLMLHLSRLSGQVAIRESDQEAVHSDTTAQVYIAERMYSQSRRNQPRQATLAARGLRAVDALAVVSSRIGQFGLHAVTAPHDSGHRRTIYVEDRSKATCV